MSTEHSDIGSEDDLAELHQQVYETRSGVVKYLLIAIGSISVFLGILGIILPIVPTTPFLLLAAICYSHSSERFYIWLLTNRFFGSYIRDWRENKGLTIATKIWIIFVLVTTMGISAIFFVPLLPVKIGLAVIGTIITLYILSLPTKRPENSSD